MDEAKGIFAVADGMGGHLAGEVASKIAIDAVKLLADGREGASFSALRSTVLSAHEAIAAHAAEHPECAGMGTTLSMMWRGGRYMYISHVGDSRIYRFREGKLEQITQDHSLVAELVRGGLITPEEARNHPRRNIITRALGTKGDNTPDLLAADTQKGDIWLLCTDGLTGMVGDGRIEGVLASCPKKLETAANRLISLALSAGGSDNVTLILYRDDEEGKAWNQD